MANKAGTPSTVEQAVGCGVNARVWGHPTTTTTGQWGWGQAGRLATGLAGSVKLGSQVGRWASPGREMRGGVGNARQLGAGQCRGRGHAVTTGGVVTRTAMLGRGRLPKAATHVRNQKVNAGAVHNRWVKVRQG